MKGVENTIYGFFTGWYSPASVKRQCSLLVFLFIISISAQSQETANFNHLDETFRYDSQFVFDSLGYVWISDSDGLYKYDGYDYFFTPYAEIFGKPHTNPRNIAFKKDAEENFWLATYDGELTRITPSGNYTSFKDSISTAKNSIRISAIQPEENFVWFGSANGTIYKYDYASSELDSVSTVPLNDNLPQQIRSIAFTDARTMWVSTFTGIIYKYARTGYGNPWERLHGPYYNPIASITKIVSDDSGFLWITSEYKGLFSYDVNHLRFRRYAPMEGLSEENNILFLSLFRDNDDKIWAGTDGNGLYCIDLKTEEIKIFKHNNANKFSLSNNTVVEINKDPNGNVWVSTKNGYIDILPNSNNNITYYSGSEKGVPTPILSILKATDGALWLGTDGFGLNKVLPDGSSIQYSNEKKDGNYFQGRYVQRLVEDSNNNIWAATYQNGLFVHEPKTDKFKKIKIEDAEGNTSADVRYLFRDSKNRIWACSGVGVHLFSTDQNELATFGYKDYGLSGTISASIAETSDGTMYIGVNNGGLFKFIENKEDPQESIFEPVTYYRKQPEDSRNLTITDMAVDGQDNLWLICTPGFLIFYDTNTSAYESFEDKNELKDIGIQSIVLSGEKKLWLGSSSGLHEYDPSTEKVKSYYVTDGLQGNSYKRRSTFQSDTGMLFFGGENGVSAFFPENMLKKETRPRLHVNTIEILHKPADHLIAEQLPKGIENVKSLDLKSHQSSFSFRFSAIENVLNTNYYYAYRLKGFDENWILPKSDLTATYTNVPSGNYVFEVRAGTKKGIWDIATKQIQINISAPWWRTGWAYALYVLFSMLLGLAIYRWVHLRNKLKREEWEFNNEKELYALKTNFFAKMSHEIQTPLSLILGPIDDMLQKATANKNRLLMQRLALIKNNAERLSRISTDLTTIRNKELNQLKIRASKNNIVKDLKRIALSFAEQARFKKIDFIQEFPREELSLWYDQDKMEHVFYNLLSNAFKFTPTEGTIQLKVVKNEKRQRLKISVIDSGPGISKSELKDIFTLFYQSDIGKNSKGSGIGLALTKELIDMHHGKIKVASSHENGSTFDVFLSLKDDIFKKEEKVLDSKDEQLLSPDSQSLHELEKDLAQLEKDESKLTHSILIVEDNVEMQIFLKDFLQKKYEVSIAENGQEGLKRAEDLNPDLIISDIMMPIMDGVEMTKALQKNKRMSHIPIILLTAKNTTKSKLLGLESGAVAYINKPFSPHELILRIKNLIASKENVISKAKTDFISNTSTELPPSKDHIFLEELVASLNRHLENPEFKLELLSETMRMSYSVIYRKCQEITGRTLVEFFRSLKMKRAALLITEQGYNISEAAFMVGYKDAKYFSKCFKDEFGTPPFSMKNESQKIGLVALAKKYKLQSV